jgi:argininosuccinate synthase
MRLNKLGGKHGVGVEYHLEDRLVGLKTRGVYEHPGAYIIVKAHKNLEKYVCTRLENEHKEVMDVKFGYLCYAALWYDPAMDDMRAFNDKINEKVDGEVKVELFKGHANVVAMTSPHGLHHVSFDNEDKRAMDFNVMNSAPFIEVYSMQMRLAQQRGEKSALLSIGKERHKKQLVDCAHKLSKLGYQLFATEKTHEYLLKQGVPNFKVYKIHEKKKPNLSQMLDQRRFDIVLNIPTGSKDKAEMSDGAMIRRKAVDTDVPIYTTVDTAKRRIRKLYEAKFGNLE